MKGGPMKEVRIGVSLTACGCTPGSYMQFRNLVATAVLVTLIGAGCRTSKPEQTYVLTRPLAGAYRDPDPTYGVPLPLKVIQAADFGHSLDDEGQKTLQWLKKQVTVGSFAEDESEADSPDPSWDFYDNWPTRFADFPWQEASRTDLVQLVNGSEWHTLSAPLADRRVLLLVTGPWVQSGQSWFPVEVWRDGSTITLVVEEWFDRLARFGNQPHRGVELLSIGKLPQGDYTLRVERRLLDLDRSEGESCHRWISTAIRSMPFRVLPAPQPPASTAPATDPADAAPRPAPSQRPAPVLDIDFGESRGGDRAAPEAVTAVRREWPVVRPFQLMNDDNAKAISHWLRIGTFDDQRWEVKPNEPAPSDQRPRLSPPDGSDDLYASVVCPVPVCDGEWVALRKVVRSRHDVTLHFDLVGKAASECKPQYYAGMVVSLGFLSTQRTEVQPVHYEPGTYRVQVVWRVIQDGGTTIPTGIDPRAADLLDRATGPVQITIP